MRRLCILLIVICIYSCEQIIEVEDISNENLVILSPVDNITLNTTAVNFAWEPLDFAEKYQLQIAQPSFEAAEAIVADTIISSTSFTKTLENSTYQWRIKATNFSYETAFTTQNLTIED